MNRPAVKIFIPDALKSILVDDWEKVTKANKLAPIPAQKSVTQFLNDYAAAESQTRREGSADADILEETIAGVKEYFNKALGRILLYRFERQQFMEWHKELEKGHGDYAGKTLCDVYGCEHLLRLFGEPIEPTAYQKRCTALTCTQSRCPTSSRTLTWTLSPSAVCARSSPR